MAMDVSAWRKRMAQMNAADELDRREREAQRTPSQRLEEAVALATLTLQQLAERGAIPEYPLPPNLAALWRQRVAKQ